MSDKKNEVVHVKGEFQLDRKALGQDVGMLGNQLLDHGYAIANNLDLNDDHKSDIAQIAPIVIKYLPVVMAMGPTLQKIFPNLNWLGIRAWVLSHAKDFFKDAAIVEHHLNELEPHIAELAKAAGELAALAPKT